MPARTVVLPNQLRLLPRAHFYVLDNEPSAELLNGILIRIRRRDGAKAVHVEPPQAYPSLGASAAYIVLKHHHEPSFLDGSDLEETRFAIVVLVAVPGFLAALTAGGFAWSDSLVGDAGRAVSPEQIGSLIGTSDVRFERLSSHSMSTNRNDIRARSYEAVDLANSLSPMGLNRQIVQGVRVRKGNRVLNTNPATGLVTESAERRSLGGYAEWVAGIANELRTARAGAPFLSYFAEAIDVDQLPAGVVPNSLLVDVQWLIDGLDHDQFELYLKKRNHKHRIPQSIVRQGVKLFSEVGVIEPAPTPGEEMPVAFQGQGAFRFLLKPNVASFGLTEERLSKIHVISKDGTVDQTLGQRLKEEKALFVGTTDVRYAFAYGKLFRDNRIKSLIGTLAEMYRSVDELRHCRSEKGEYPAPLRASAFAHGSVFRVVEDNIAVDDDLLICDDLSDEWADHIGIDTSEQRITLYHSKHGDRATGSASAFHDLIGQALKNASRLNVVHEDVARKLSSWGGKWNGTGIPRLRRGKNPDQFGDAYCEASTSPIGKKRVALVTSFASKALLENLAQRVLGGGSVEAHETQLIWFLVSFASTCKENGAEPVVFCQP